MIRFLELCVFLLVLFNVSTQQDGAAFVLGDNDDTTPLKVAIIGAGAAGSSAAYHLRAFSHQQPSSRPVDITIFESNPYIGGRSTTVNALNDSRYPAELGASIFGEVNKILYGFAKDHGLLTASAFHDRPKESPDSLGIWDGQQFVFTQSSSSSKTWDIVKLLLRYGLSPIRTRRMMQKIVGKFLKMYEEPVFPFRSLDDAVQSIGLLDTTAATGKELLEKGGVSNKFAREIVQASTRVNYGQNLAAIHGLEAMVCMAADNAMSIQGGNWKIFDKMVEESGAKVRLSNTVTDVIKREDGGYSIVSKDSSVEGETGSDRMTEKQMQEFDTIILAAPFQFSNITFTPPLSHVLDKIPYVKLHVTLLTSPHRIDPRSFNKPSQEILPEMLITTLPADLNLGNATGRAEVGPMQFWSISTLRAIKVRYPTTEPFKQIQYLYKIFSPERLSPNWLASMLAVDFNGSDDRDVDSIASMSKRDVSWSYEKVWHSYPYEFPRLTFEKVRLEGDAHGRGVWYTSGIESFISTMETSALMGKNVARLILDEIGLEAVEETHVEL